MLPKITVVTPSFNQGSYIEQTILSVIGQGYPKLEYIVMDGGSSDESVTIIKKYQENITYWQSKKDDGQADAINEGFKLSTGDILCWLNSDDMFLPGALLHIGRLFAEETGPRVIFGNCLHMYENNEKARGSDVAYYAAHYDLEHLDYIIQPSSFWNRKTWEDAGPLNTAYNYVFDWEWFIRLKKMKVLFTPTPNYLSVYRIHEQHKSGSGGEKRSLEIGDIYRKNGHDQFSTAYQRWNKLQKSNTAFVKLAHFTNKYRINSLSRLVSPFILPGATNYVFKCVSRM